MTDRTDVALSVTSWYKIGPRTFAIIKAAYPLSVAQDKMAPLATCSETVLYFHYLLHYCHLFNDYDFGNGCRSREDGKRDHSDMAVKRIWSVEKTDEGK